MIVCQIVWENVFFHKDFFFCRNVGLSVNQIAALLENPAIPDIQRNVVLFPPDQDTVSDEDSEEEDDTGIGMNINHLGPGMLQMAAEIEFDDPVDELPDIQQLNDDGQVGDAVEDELDDEHGDGQPPHGRSADVPKLDR